jgi:hypothetical protein
MIRFVGFYRRSEEDADSAIDDPPVERRPRVNGPSTVGMAIGTHERVVARLTNISQVLGIDEDSNAVEALFHKRSNEELPNASRPIGVVLQRLLPDVVQLETSASPLLRLPHHIHRRVVPGREGHFAPKGRLFVQLVRLNYA